MPWFRRQKQTTVIVYLPTPERRWRDVVNVSSLIAGLVGLLVALGVVQPLVPSATSVIAATTTTVVRQPLRWWGSTYGTPSEVQYDDLGRITSITYPAPSGVTTRMVYDSLGRPTTSS